MGSRLACATPGCKGRARKKSRICIHCYQQNWYQKHRPRILAAHSERAAREGWPKRGLKYDVLQLQSAMQKVEERNSQIMHFLGMSAPRLPRDVTAVLLMVETLMKPIDYHQVVSADYIRYWAGVFFGVNDEYLRAVGLLLESKEPWRLFIDFANRLERKLVTSGGAALLRSNELAMAERYLNAASSHLWYVSYIHCLRRHGHYIAGEVFGERPSAVKEMVAVALLH